MPRRVNRKTSRFFRASKPHIVMSDPAQTKAILSLRRKVGQLTKGTETKIFDQYQGGTAGTSATVSYSFNNVMALAQPSRDLSDDGMVGDKLNPFYVTVKGTVFQNSATATPETVRIILLKCKPGNGFVPNIASGTLTTSGVVTGQGSIQAVWNPVYYGNKSEFTILYDRLFTLTGNDAGQSSFNFKINKKISGVIEFQPASTTAEGGQLYLMAISTTPTGSNPPFWYFSSRVYYKDA